MKPVESAAKSMAPATAGEKKAQFGPLPGASSASA